MQKYFVEIIEPRIVEVDANSGDDAIQRVKSIMANKLKLQNNIDFKIVREVEIL